MVSDIFLNSVLSASVTDCPFYDIIYYTTTLSISSENNGGLLAITSDKVNSATFPRLFVTGGSSASITAPLGGIVKANYTKIAGKTKLFNTTMTWGSLAGSTYSTTVIAECAWSVESGEVLTVVGAGTSGAGVIGTTMVLEFTPF